MFTLDNEELVAMRARNAQRAKEVIEKMGDKWLLHPKNQITKRKFKQTLRKARKVYHG